MMSALYQFTMHTAAMAVICMLLEYMMPDSKLKKTVRFSISVVFVLSVVGILTSGIRGGNAEFSFDAFVFEGQAPGKAAKQAETGITHEGLLREYYKDILSVE